ncbi:MAG TPA: AAA family ATPase [Candidatus Limnocylindrales bacterium]|nr:AAA family ATPase [Candidatus Limnocylindrales bacterium]
MRISRLQITDLRRYRDLDITLSPGFTVVRGPNEAGKTTIQRAIELVLTRKCTSGSADLDSLRPWDAPDESRPIIAIDFEEEDVEGIHEGHLEKAFRGPKGYVRLAFNGSETTDPALADEQLAALTGIPTEAFFRSTASVRHHEVDDLAGEDGTLRDRLQASISGADRGTSRARRKLERALADLNTRGPKNPGRLKVAEDAVAQSQSAVEAGDLALAQLEHDRDALVGAREQRTEADRAVAEQRAMLEKARAAERLAAERDAAQARFERYRQAVAVRDEIAVLQESHPSADPLPVLRQVVLRLRTLDARIRELKALLSGEVSVKYEVTTPDATWLPIAGAAIALIVGGAAAAIAAEIGVIDTPIAAIVGVVAIVVGIGLALFARRRRKSLLDLRRHKELEDVEIDRRLRGRSQLEEELRLAQTDTAKQLESLALPNLAAAEERLLREEEHVARIDVLAAQLEGLVGKEPHESLPATRDAAALEVEQKTHALESLGPIAREPRARERLEVAVHDAEGDLERCRDAEANARAKVEANPVDAEQVAAHAERAASWGEQLGALQRRARVYQTTLDAIERAERATMRTATHYLEKRMVVDLERITGGRYRRVRVDDKTLDIEVLAPERGAWVPVTSLSQGTLDVVYLAARLGLVRLVTGDRRPPLVFDDPFVTLDDGRATRAVQLLREVARDFQVIYLTTSDRYDSAADSVVELPGPTAVDDAREAAPVGVDA